jgi:hypothetical protein
VGATPSSGAASFSARRPRANGSRTLRRPTYGRRRGHLRLQARERRRHDPRLRARQGRIALRRLGRDFDEFDELSIVQDGDDSVLFLGCNSVTVIGVAGLIESDFHFV